MLTSAFDDAFEVNTFSLSKVIKMQQFCKNWEKISWRFFLM